MRRIIAQDKEVKRSSKEAIWLIGKATELLLQQIASDLAGLVAKQGRSTIRYQDIETHLKHCPALRTSPLADLVPHNPPATHGKAAAATGAVEAANSTPKITSFFQRV